MASTSSQEPSADYDKRITIVVPVVFAVLSLFVYFLRLFARRMTAAKWGVDDLLMGIGLLLSFGATFSTVWSEHEPFSSLRRSLQRSYF